MATLVFTLVVLAIKERSFVQQKSVGRNRPTPPN